MKKKHTPNTGDKNKPYLTPSDVQYILLQYAGKFLPPFHFLPFNLHAFTEGDFELQRNQFFFLLHVKVMESCLGKLKTEQKSLHVLKDENNLW